MDSNQKTTRRRRLEKSLVLQGGGALGAYEVGAYRAMKEMGHEPQVVSGISIGAINAAIISGNTPDLRLPKLLRFWEMIAAPANPFIPNLPGFEVMHHVYGVAHAFMAGQPNFFRPRMTNPWFSKPGTPAATSFYDTEPLKKTLLELVDFDLINSRRTQLFLGACRVSTGEYVVFDNKKITITPEHVMASGALAPGFPAIEIDGHWYYDGGLVSNTPVDAVLDHNIGKDKLIFVPYLFGSNGKHPRTVAEVQMKVKQIRFASRSAHDQHRVHVHHILRQLKDFLEQLPPEACMSEKVSPNLLAEFERRARENKVTLVGCTYREPDYATEWSDVDFSPVTIANRLAAGYADMMNELKKDEVKLAA